MSGLPNTWIETEFGEVLAYGATDKAEPGEIADDAWILELEDIEKDSSRIPHRYTFAERRSKSTKNRFEEGDVLYGKLRPYLNKVVLADAGGYCTTEIVPIKPTAATESRYIFYWLKTPTFLQYASEVSHGLNMPRLGTDAGRRAPFRLAPLAEQKRIADKLDALLGRVAACQERLDRVPRILERFRQSVLAAATSGELTREWRSSRTRPAEPWEVSVRRARLPAGFERLKKHAFKLVPLNYCADQLPEGWARPTIGELYDSYALLDFADGNHGSLYPRKGDFGDVGVRFLTATQIGDAWELDLKTCPRLKQAKARQLVKGWARRGDVLLSHNATVGRVALLEDAQEEVILGTSVTFYRFNPTHVIPDFGRIVFSSPFFQDQLASVMHQTTRNQVPITKQVSLRFLCPPLEEQMEIVARVARLFRYEEAVRRRLQSVEKGVSPLTERILQSAFRGELVPQDPDDEPASDLLERIRAARAQEEKRKPKRGDKRRPRFRKTPEAAMMTRSDAKPNHLSEILKERGALNAEALWKASRLGIDEFYEQLKAEEAQGFLRERREAGTVSVRLLESTA